MNKLALALLTSAVLVVAAAPFLSSVSAGPAAESSRGRKGPWMQCPPKGPDRPTRETYPYSRADAAKMAALQAEVIELVEEMNAIVRRTNGKPGPDGPVVQFTLFTGCPEDGAGGVMMEFLQQPGGTELADSFFDVFVDVGDGGGGNGGSGGCHCETNMVSCEGPCPC